MGSDGQAYHLWEVECWIVPPLDGFRHCPCRYEVSDGKKSIWVFENGGQWYLMRELEGDSKWWRLVVK